MPGLLTHVVRDRTSDPRLVELTRLLTDDAEAAVGSQSAGEHGRLADRACRLWLALDSPPHDVVSHLDRWRDRHPQVESIWYASVASRLVAGDTEGAVGLHASWPGDGLAAVGGGRWWAGRLVDEVVRDNLRRPDRPEEPPRPEPAGTTRSEREPWVRDVISSLRAAATSSSAQVVVLHAGPARDGLARSLIEAAYDEGLRAVLCALDDATATHPLDGWLGTLWGDIHWRFHGDRRWARLAPVIDHHLGWDRSRIHGHEHRPTTVDTRRSDAVLVEIALRLTGSTPDALVVVVAGGGAALGWFDHLAHLVRRRRPATDVLRFVDVRLGTDEDRWP